MAAPEPLPPSCDEGAPEWMVTFADLMSLLLTFFVLLLAMSTMDTKRVKMALGSLRGALGVLDGGGEPIKGRTEVVDLPQVTRGELAMMSTLERVIDRHDDTTVSNDFIQIGHTDERIVITLDDSLLFAPGSTRLLPQAYPFLEDFSGVLATSGANVDFVGHADASPASEGTTNWRVAAERAASVLEYVQQASGLPGYRLKLSSKGHYAPRASNESPQGRARNRRVELVLTFNNASDHRFYGEDRVVPVEAGPSGDSP